MAKKYYVVWKGRETGIFNDWDSCHKQVAKFAGAKFKSFASKTEAENAFNSGSGASSPKAKSSSTRSTQANKIKTYSADEVDALDCNVKIFTDGGCEPNPGEAGSGIAVYRDNVVSELWFGLYNPQGTNNTAELNALKHAMRLAFAEIESEKSVAIFCDSKYSIQCVTQWAVGWEKKGWVRKGGEIKNLKLIQDMFVLYQSIKKDVKILHVNGHAGIEGNELADRMSILAIQSKEKKLKPYTKKIDVTSILKMQNG
jgi:ribonuclease HI